MKKIKLNAIMILLLASVLTLSGLCGCANEDASENALKNTLSSIDETKTVVYSTEGITVKSTRRKVGEQNAQPENEENTLKFSLAIIDNDGTMSIDSIVDDGEGEIKVTHYREEGEYEFISKTGELPELSERDYKFTPIAESGEEFKAYAESKLKSTDFNALIGGFLTSSEKTENGYELTFDTTAKISSILADLISGMEKSTADTTVSEFITLSEADKTLAMLKGIPAKEFLDTIIKMGAEIEGTAKEGQDLYDYVYENYINKHADEKVCDILFEGKTPTEIVEELSETKTELDKTTCKITLITDTKNKLTEIRLEIKFNLTLFGTSNDIEISGAIKVEYEATAVEIPKK